MIQAAFPVMASKQEHHAHSCGEGRPTELEASMLVISASNVAMTKDKAQSLVVANRIGELYRTKGEKVEVLDLRDYRIEPCDMCQGCAGSGLCTKPDDFNRFLGQWRAQDRVVIVCPHYAGIPAKLVAIAEKLQELAYLGYCLGRQGKPGPAALIVAHGGMTEDYEALYEANLIKPLSGMLKGTGCTMVNEAVTGGPLCFGVKTYRKQPDEFGVCFAKDNDEEKVAAVLARLEGQPEEIWKRG